MTIDLSNAKPGDKFGDAIGTTWVYAREQRRGPSAYDNYHVLSCIQKNGIPSTQFFSKDGKCEYYKSNNLVSKISPTMPFYAVIPNTQVTRSKIDVFQMVDPNSEDEGILRVELLVDNAGAFITGVSNGAREDVSIGHKDLAIALARAILEAYDENF